MYPFLKPFLTVWPQAFSVRRVLATGMLGLATFVIQGQTHTTVSKTVLENLGPNVNSTASELHPVISADGKTLYFVRDGHSGNYANQDAWYCERTTTGWGPAVHPGEPINYRGKASGVSKISNDKKKLLVGGAFLDRAKKPVGYKKKNLPPTNTLYK
jgi:hypothetical protein